MRVVFLDAVHTMPALKLHLFTKWIFHKVYESLDAHVRASEHMTGVSCSINDDLTNHWSRKILLILFSSLTRAMHTSTQTLDPYCFSQRNRCNPLGILCQLCYKPAEGLSGSLEGRSHDDGAAVNIPRAIDLGGNLLQSGRDRLLLPHHAESRSDDL
jgi:hypothetical protein